MGSLRKRCKTFGCPNLHRNRSGYCDECEARYRAKHPRKDDRLQEVRRAYGSYAWRKFAADYLKAHPVCAICGAPATCVDHRDMTADMMVDAFGGFDYDPSHYQALCTSCNARKGMKEDKAMRAGYEADKTRLAALSQQTPGGGFEKHPRGVSTAFVETVPHTGRGE